MRTSWTSSTMSTGPGGARVKRTASVTISIPRPRGRGLASTDPAVQFRQHTGAVLVIEGSEELRDPLVVGLLTLEPTTGVDLDGGNNFFGPPHCRTEAVEDEVEIP